MKKVFSVFLALTMLVCLCIPAAAAEANEEDSEVSDLFIHVCDLFFSGKGEAYDKNGNDVTTSFYSSYITAYVSGNYAAIKNGCISAGVSCIKTHDVATIQPRLTLTKTYEEMSYHLIEQKGFPYNGKTWGFVVWATGSFSYYDSTFQISSYTDPSLSYTYDGLGAAFVGSVTGTTVTRPSLINNRTTLTFTVNNTHEVSVPIPGVDLITGTIGPFETESVFTISV